MKRVAPTFSLFDPADALDDGIVIVLVESELIICPTIKLVITIPASVQTIAKILPKMVLGAMSPYL